MSTKEPTLAELIVNMRERGAAVRSASVEAAKSYLDAEWDERLEAHLTDTIESHLAPVVAAAVNQETARCASITTETLRQADARLAAAEEAMKEKCCQIVRRVRILDAINGTVGPTTFAAEIDAEIRAIPTGRARKDGSACLYSLTGC